jgi:hypothetical protein
MKLKVVKAKIAIGIHEKEDLFIVRQSSGSGGNFIAEMMHFDGGTWFSALGEVMMDTLFEEVEDEV